MGGHITRRGALIGSMLAIPALSLSIRSTEAAAASRVDLGAAFKSLEEKTGARLGVSAHDTGSDNRIDYRENERFAMCSTFKFLASAAVLARVDRKRRSSAGLSSTRKVISSRTHREWKSMSAKACPSNQFARPLSR
jgi:beta-lactamase class A